MGLKLKLSGLKSSDGSSGEKKSASVGLGGLKSVQEAAAKAKAAEETAEAKTGSLKLSALRSAATNEETPAEQAESKGITLVFTEGVEYDLDEIVAIKRRDNANVPLILKVDKENEYDGEIIKDIQRLILTDYGVDYSEDPGADTYLEKAEVIDKVPDYYYVFDEYFNRYYAYYYNNYKDKTTGGISIGLEAIKDAISSYHTSYLDLIGNGTAANAVMTADNKARIDYEIGTLPDTGESGGGGYADIDISLFKLAIVDGKLTMTYDGETIENPIEFKTIGGESIFGPGEVQSKCDCGLAFKDVTLKNPDKTDIFAEEGYDAQTQVIVHTVGVDRTDNLSESDAGVGIIAEITNGIGAGAVKTVTLTLHGSSTDVSSFKAETISAAADFAYSDATLSLTRDVSEEEDSMDEEEKPMEAKDRGIRQPSASIDDDADYTAETVVMTFKN
jgi:hypothetical protein